LGQQAKIGLLDARDEIEADLELPFHAVLVVLVRVEGPTCALRATSARSDPAQRIRRLVSLKTASFSDLCGEAAMLIDFTDFS